MRPHFEFYTARISAREVSEVLQNRGGLDLPMYARNFEDNLEIPTKNALELDHQKPVKLSPCTYIKRITGQLSFD